MTEASTGALAEAAGAALLRAVATMDRLRSPGGCPWDAEQTHRSLAPYLIEEAYETLDAIETDDLAGLREELGDLLLQVLFHARLAEEEAGGFSIVDVAGDLVAKLERRHPHVFGDVDVASAAEVNANWDAIKQREKQRSSATEGIALGQPALALAAKLVSRSGKAGTDVALPDGGSVGDRLFVLAAEAVRSGIDPELALRHTARRYAEAIRTVEASRPAKIETVPGE
ncbi:MazG family protein [Jatrophihabitans telluris]|uniref:MazG family protein n=1 Tax=Jatrophihabitans telluris TaxID=2038343 RepID=A0ABY4R0Z4_9ACTN|nr:MazG family protein [Jatrophihabitans telluris]UQX89380.1 MazG family protein [Jatrophihabitans telluris]